MDKSIKDVIACTGHQPSRIVVFMGNASFKHNSPGHPPSLGWRRWAKRMREAHGLLVIEVNEFRTSQARAGVVHVWGCFVGAGLDGRTP